MHTLAVKGAPHLDARLAAAASLVLPGGTVADIGCDHGKLTAYLACTGNHDRIIAADLRPSPLESAKQTCLQAGCSHKVEFRLGDGLQVLQPGEAQSIVLAGVSALTTIQIIQQAPWVFAPGVRLVLVPATKPELLRQWLWEQGFALVEERLVQAAGRWYVVMGAEYTGQPSSHSLLECYLGPEGAKPQARAYREHLLQRLRKHRKGLEEDPARAAEIDQLLLALQQLQE